MTTGRQQVDIILFYMNWNLAVCLHRIRMEQNLFPMGDLPDLTYRLNTSDLIVCIHYRHQHCI